MSLTTGLIKFDRLVELAMAIIPSAEIDCTNKHLSFAMNKNRVIAIGYNRHKTHPLCVKYGYPLLGIHSEMSVLIQVGAENLSGLTLVNIRLSGDSFRGRIHRPILRNSKPCKRCMPWCMTLFKKIYYSTNQGFEQL